MNGERREDDRLREADKVELVDRSLLRGHEGVGVDVHRVPEGEMGAGGRGAREGRS